MKTVGPLGPGANLGGLLNQLLGHQVAMDLAEQAETQRRRHTPTSHPEGHGSFFCSFWPHILHLFNSRRVSLGRHVSKCVLWNTSHHMQLLAQSCLTLCNPMGCSLPSWTVVNEGRKDSVVNGALSSVIFAANNIW